MSEQIGNETIVNVKPLVTFAVFAYNQEKYIREAVEAALAQDYTPLEIILSDDCSSDRTFEFMQEMAEAYTGPHTVRVRRSLKNIGVFPHVVSVAKEAKGALFILSAGDDISKQNRVSKLAMAWKASGAWGLHSKYDVIDDAGSVLIKETYSKDLTSSSYSLRKYFFLDDGVVDIVHGATSAYDKRLFDFIEQRDAEDILSEDGALSLILNLFNLKIFFLEESLVQYRRHSGALTNTENKGYRLSFKDIKSQVFKSEFYNKTIENRARLLLNFSVKFNSRDLRRVNTLIVERDIFIFQLKNNWYSIGVINRIISIFQIGSIREMRWFILRLFGQRQYVLFLYFKNKINFSKI